VETTAKWVPSAQGRLLPRAMDGLGLARFAGAKVLAPLVSRATVVCCGSPLRPSMSALAFGACSCTQYIWC
jgi:hypothetical protein